MAIGFERARESGIPRQVGLKRHSSYAIREPRAAVQGLACHPTNRVQQRKRSRVFEGRNLRQRCLLPRFLSTRVSRFVLLEQSQALFARSLACTTYRAALISPTDTPAEKSTPPSSDHTECPGRTTFRGVSSDFQRESNVREEVYEMPSLKGGEQLK